LVRSKGGTGPNLVQHEGDPVEVFRSRGGGQNNPDWLAKRRAHRRESTIAGWKVMAGEQFQLLMSSADSALSLMRHSTADVRAAARSVCLQYWHCEHDERYVSACIELATTDPVEHCRIGAIRALGIALSGTKDRRIQHFLAQIVSDAQNSNSVRNAAYVAVDWVENGPTVEFATWIPTADEMLFDIDWDRIRRLSRESDP
jgi:hypothetical protein